MWWVLLGPEEVVCPSGERRRGAGGSNAVGRDREWTPQWQKLQQDGSESVPPLPPPPVSDGTRALSGRSPLHRLVPPRLPPSPSAGDCVGCPPPSPTPPTASKEFDGLVRSKASFEAFLRSKVSGLLCGPNRCQRTADPCSQPPRPQICPHHPIPPVSPYGSPPHPPPCPYPQR